MVSYIQNTYSKSDFKFVDVIFTVSLSPPTTSVKYYSLQEILNHVQPEPDIIERTTDINFGGKLKRKHRKTKYMTKKQSKKGRKNQYNTNKKTKLKRNKTKLKRNKTKKLKTVKYRQNGGEVDEYIKMVEEIDKQNNVPSLILHH